MNTPEKPKSSIFRYFVYACPFLSGVLASLAFAIPFKGGGLGITLGLLAAACFFAMLSFLLSLVGFVIGQIKVGIWGLLLSIMVPIPLTLFIIWGSSMLVPEQRERFLKSWGDVRDAIAYQMESSSGNSLQPIEGVKLEPIQPADQVRESRSPADPLLCHPLSVKNQYISEVLWSSTSDLAFVRTDYALWQVDLRADRQLVKAGFMLLNSAQVALVGDDLLILNYETEELLFVNATDLTLDVALRVPKALRLAAHPDLDMCVITLTDYTKARLLSVSKREQIRLLLPSELPEEHWVETGQYKSLHQPSYQSVKFSADGRYLILLAGEERDYFSVLDNDVQYYASEASFKGDKPQPYGREIEDSSSANGYIESDFGTLNDKLHVKGESLRYRKGEQLEFISAEPRSLSPYHDMAVVKFEEHGKDYYLMVYQDPQAPQE